MPAAKQRLGSECGRRIRGCDEAREPLHPFSRAAPDPVIGEPRRKLQGMRRGRRVAPWPGEFAEHGAHVRHVRVECSHGIGPLRRRQPRGQRLDAAQHRTDISCSSRGDGAGLRGLECVHRDGAQQLAAGRAHGAAHLNEARVDEPPDHFVQIAVERRIHDLGEQVGVGVRTP